MQVTHALEKIAVTQLDEESANREGYAAMSPTPSDTTPAVRDRTPR